MNQANERQNGYLAAYRMSNSTSVPINRRYWEVLQVLHKRYEMGEYDADSDLFLVFRDERLVKVHALGQLGCFRADLLGEFKGKRNEKLEEMREYVKWISIIWLIILLLYFSLTVTLSVEKVHADYTGNCLV